MGEVLWEKYKEISTVLTREQYQMIRRFVCNSKRKNSKSTSVTRPKYKEDYLKNLVEDKNITYGDLAKQIEEKGYPVNRDSIRRRIKRADKHSDYDQLLAECLDVPVTYLSNGIVYEEDEIGYQKVRRIAGVHRKSSLFELLYPATEAYEKECFDQLPEEVKQALIVLMRELATII